MSSDETPIPSAEDEATDLWLLLFKFEADDRKISLENVSDEVLRAYAAKGYTVGAALEEICK